MASNDLRKTLIEEASRQTPAATKASRCSHPASILRAPFRSRCDLWSETYNSTAMHSPSFHALALSALLTLSLFSRTAASDDKEPFLPCVVKSPNSGSFYDLRSLSVSLPNPDKKPVKGARTESWQAKGYDYNANFSMNICAPVVEDVQDLNGIDQKYWKNVSGFYKKGDKTFSIG